MNHITQKAGITSRLHRQHVIKHDCAFHMRAVPFHFFQEGQTNRNAKQKKKSLAPLGTTLTGYDISLLMCAHYFNTSFGSCEEKHISVGTETEIILLNVNDFCPSIPCALGTRQVLQLKGGTEKRAGK